MVWPVLRGEIWQVDLDPARGTEANKQRPAVIVSNDRANVTATQLGRGVVTVVPVTSNTDKVFPFQVLLSAITSGLQVDSKAQAEQVRSIATQRLLRRIGRVSPGELSDIDEALRLHLAL
ncbi:MAG TPA: type II toxin-antitoxin system PemK/MazF family toxin [Mycobacterium sp.]|nr:type II toxin-antitoxin system PemK/MazF family toxin [Mycobacterium sp.]